MRKLGIVVQRCHESIVGGSEALAWQYAQLLSRACDVEILTTTATDYITWANVLEAGTETHDGFRVRRFPVTLTRSPYWTQLHLRLLQDFRGVIGEPQTPGAERRRPWSLALEEEFIRHQGPYSDPLFEFLGAHWQDYEALLFVAYLYPTSYFGALHVPASHAILVPTVHDEPTAYLGAFRYVARRARSVIWLTEAEQRVGQAIWGHLKGRVAAMPVETAPVAPRQLGYPYLLYSGRLDQSKNCDKLIDFFLRWKAGRENDVRLVLTGDDKMGLAAHPAIEYLGFVPPHEKFALMAGAAVFVMPSAWESFSIATLEAMAQGTCILVNGACTVLADHVELSGAGKAYTDYDSFSAALDELFASPERRAALSAKAKDYVLSRYTPDRVRSALLEAVATAA